jgi:nucleoid-associated protein YgaU
MRRVRVLLLLLLVAAAAAAYFGFYNGPQAPSVPGTDDSGSRPAGADQAAHGAAVRPTFDVVRAEPTGELVMAGRAEPGWTVTVESNGKTLGSAVADANGEWIIQPSSPVAKGEHSLQLKSQSPKGDKMMFSKQRLALSLGGDGTGGRPLVALTEEGEPTRVLQMSPPLSDEKRLAAATSNATANIQPPSTPAAVAAAAPAESPTQVSFTSVDYEQTGGRSMVYLGGRGTPGSRLMLYADNIFMGTATVDASGGWTFKAVRDLAAGAHALRADSVELANGKVLARAEVNFDRQGPQSAQASAATPRATPAALASADPQAAKPADDNSGAVKVADNSAAIAQSPDEANVIVVRRGDTLWHIAQERYGSGAKFTEIFQNNKNQIRNPNLIYPTQRSALPH